ncbi:MAG: TRAP transporter small permease subunit [Pseudomonadota bacterium]
MPESQTKYAELPETRFSVAVTRFFDRMTSALSWIWLALLLVIVANVAMRYIFSQGRVELEELQWHLYALGFLLALSACLSANQHVRVDILHEKLSLRHQAWVELYGLLLLFFPFVFMVFWYSIPFVAYSFSFAEVSDAPGGLPYRWAIKAALPAAMILLLLAGAGRLSRVWTCLFLSSAEKSNRAT